MATKKAKKLMPKRNLTTTCTGNPWDDIPQKLSYVIFRRRTSDYNVYFGTGFTKSWKISPKQCHPTGKSTSSLPQLCETKDLETHEFSGMCQVPFWDDNIPYKNAASLSLHNDFNNIAIAVTGISSPTFVYYRQTSPWYTPTKGYFSHNPDLHKWTKEYCKTIDPNSSDQEYIQLGSIVEFNGKFYAMSLQGTLVVIEEVDSRMIITNVSSKRGIPSVAFRHFREYLIQSKGEILLIFCISTKWAGTTDNLEIFRLRSEKLAWEKVESLGDRVVFVGANICLIISASEVGCKGNCVYFTNSGVDGWRVYDMARGDISPWFWRRDV